MDAAAALSLRATGQRVECGWEVMQEPAATWAVLPQQSAVLSHVRSAAWLKVKPSPKSAAKEAWPRQDEARDESPRRDAIAQEAVRFVRPVFHLWERRGLGPRVWSGPFSPAREATSIRCRMAPCGRRPFPSVPRRCGCFVTGCLFVYGAVVSSAETSRNGWKRIPAPMTYSCRRGLF